MEPATGLIITSVIIVPYYTYVLYLFINNI